MSDSTHIRRERSLAWGLMLTALRAERLGDYQRLFLARARERSAAQKALADLRRKHPERAMELYREQLLARGLPAPKRQPGRWPGGDR